jgi:hypothetical protein
LEKHKCRLALPKSSSQIRVSRPNLVRDLIAFDVRFCLYRADAGPRLRHPALSRASIKDSPLKIETQVADQIGSMRPGVWRL